MKKTTSIAILIISNIFFCQQLTNQLWEIRNDDGDSLLDRIHTNHYFSMASNSFEGGLNTYGIYSNSSYLNLNQKTRVYGDFSIMHPLSGQSNFDKLNYSVSLGLNYQINKNTFLSFEINRMNCQSINPMGLQNRTLP